MRTHTDVEVVTILPKIYLFYDKGVVSAHLLNISFVLDLAHAVVLDELRLLEDLQRVVEAGLLLAGYLEDHSEGSLGHEVFNVELVVATGFLEVRVEDGVGQRAVPVGLAAPRSVQGGQAGTDWRSNRDSTGGFGEKGAYLLRVVLLRLRKEFLAAEKLQLSRRPPLRLLRLQVESCCCCRCWKKAGSCKNLILGTAAD